MKEIDTKIETSLGWSWSGGFCRGEEEAVASLENMCERK